VAGGGAVEAALSIYLENFALTLGTREQLAVAAFAGERRARGGEARLRWARGRRCALPPTRCPCARCPSPLPLLHVPRLPCPQDALLVIPKQLAINGAQDATDLVAKLRSKHHTAQVDPSQAALNRMGLDVYEGAVVDNVAMGVLEPTISKLKILQFATEAAVTILRIDDMIKINPQQQGGR
jgi:T-complex protein 1 subunit alpha